MPVQHDFLSTPTTLLVAFLPPCSICQVELLHSLQVVPMHIFSEDLAKDLHLIHPNHAFYLTPTSPRLALDESHIDRLYSGEIVVQ